MSSTLFGTALIGLWISDKLVEKMPATTEQKTKDLPATAAKV